MKSSNDIIQSLYLTVYDRPADWKDLLYWSEQLHTLGLTRLPLLLRSLMSMT